MPNNWYHTPNYNNTTWAPKTKKTKVLESDKRVAQVKEKIVITDKHFASDFMIGNVFTVTQVNDSSVSVEEVSQGVSHWEYEVITKSEEVFE